jgi:hypothetical protein
MSNSKAPPSQEGGALLQKNTTKLNLAYHTQTLVFSSDL